MAFDALRSRLRSLASDSSEAARETGEHVRETGRTATQAVARRAPGTGLEGGRKPAAPSTREKIAMRLQGAGQIRKPIGDANLEPGADPRYIERFARGDDDAGQWFGEGEPRGDPYQTYFASGQSPDNVEFGPFAQELFDEQDHEAGHYAYEDEREEGWLDDGIDVDVSGVGIKW